MTHAPKKRTSLKLAPAPLYVACALVLLTMLLLASPAIASEGAGWRSTYDLVMRWVNFFILVFLLVKFGRKPLLGFLGEQKKSVETQLAKLEQRRQTVMQDMAALEEKMAARDKRLSEIVEQTRLQAEQERQQIVDGARAESAILLENAKTRIQARLVETKMQFRTELLDMAVDIAAKELPQVITADDQNRLLGTYLANAFKAA
jgi:F-type H+-transporting ATPase subunit b